jgi:hypothetical protein
LRRPQKFNCQLLTILGLVQLCAAAYCGASELNAWKHTEPTMRVSPKSRWKATASSGAPQFAVDDRYATTWVSKSSKKTWLKIDLGKTATLAGLEVYWGKQAPGTYGFEASMDGKTWAHLCTTRHGEAGRTSLHFLQWPPEWCAGLAASPNRSGAWRLSKSIFMAPATRHR